MGTAMSENLSLCHSFEEMNSIPDFEAVKKYEDACSKFLLDQALKVPVSDVAVEIYQRKFKEVIGLEAGELAKLLVEAFPLPAALAIGGLAVGVVPIAIFIDSVLQTADERTKLIKEVQAAIVEEKRTELEGVLSANIEELHTRVNHYSSKEQTSVKLNQIDSEVLRIVEIAYKFLDKPGEKWSHDDFKMFVLFKMAVSVYLINAEMMCESGIIDAKTLSESRQNRYSQLLHLVPEYLKFRRSQIGTRAGRAIVAHDVVEVPSQNELRDNFTRTYQIGSAMVHAVPDYMAYLSRDAWTLAVAIGGSLQVAGSDVHAEA